MAKSEDLTLNVKVKGANAVDDLADSFEKVETASKDAGRDIDQLISKVNKLGSGKAADLLLTHNFGEINNEIADLIFKLDSLDAEDPEVDVTVARLTELQGDLDTVTSKLKELNAAEATIDIRADTSQVEGGLKRTKQGLDDTRNSADQSRSVLANMVGNSAQDLGNLGGIAGSAGVAIGQMAEYAADGNIALRNLAGVAGPLLGVAAATALISKHLANQAQFNAWKAEQVENYREAVEAVGPGFEAIEEHLRTLDDFSFESKASIFEAVIGGDKIDDMRVSLGALGLTISSVSQMIADGDDGRERFNQQLEDAGLIAGELREPFLDWFDIQQQLPGAADDATEAMNKFLEIGTGGIDDMNAALEEQSRQLSDTEASWNTLLTDLRDGKIDTAAAAQAWNDLAQELQLTDEQMAELVGTKLNEFIKDQADAVEGLNDVWLRYAQIQASNKAQAASMVDTTEDINAALAEQRTETGLTSAAWTDLLADVADGNVDTERATGLWNLLRKELGLTEPEMVALVQTKLDEKLEADAVALEEAATAALEMAEAMADLGDTIADIDTDDLANLSGALESELNKVDDIFAGLKFDVDFQPALAEALEGLDSFAPDLQTLADEWADILEGKPINIFGNVRADDAEFQEKMAGLTNLFQEGVVNAFDQGGVAAANTFVQSTAAQIAASTGLDISEVYRIMGVGPNGEVDAIVKPHVDAEATADAIAILEGLAGVDNPVAAYLRLALLSDEIPPQIAEIAAKILAGQELGVPAKLEGVAQADIEAALAWLAGYGVTVDVEVDDGGTVGQFKDDADEATEDRTTQVIVPKSDSLGQMQTLIDHVARARTVAFNSKADNAGQIDGILDAVAADRDSEIWVRLPNANQVNRDLENLARDRHSNIIVHTVRVGGGGGGGPTAGPVMMPVGPAPMATTTEGGGVGVSTLTAPAPMSISPVTMVAAPAGGVTNNFAVSVQAAVIGNRHEVERTVAKALRSYTRLNGSRN